MESKQSIPDKEIINTKLDLEELGLLASDDEY